MKYRGTFLILMLPLLTQCGPAGRSATSATPDTGSTGYVHPTFGADYVIGGDDRVRRALLEEPVTPSVPEEPVSPVQPTQPTQPSQPIATEPKLLRERLREFEISRYDEGAKTPSRFGSKRFRLKVFFTNEAPVEFAGQLIGSKPRFEIQAQNGKYSLTGFIEDQTEQSKGEFMLYGNGEEARIFYWAYPASMNVRRDRLAVHTPGSSVDNQIRMLSENTFGWVNNWTVVRGTAFFLVDVVRVLKPEQPVEETPEPVISFSGPSLRTGEQVYEVEVAGGGESVKKATLVGNGEEEPVRSFSVTLTDEKTKEEEEIMVDVDLTEAFIFMSPNDSQPDTNPAPMPTPVENRPEAPQQQQVVVPFPLPRDARPKDPAPVHSDAYLRVDQTLTRTSRMTRDFARNFEIAGVQDAIKEFQGNRRQDLSRFFKYANPFRRIMETVGRAFDVSPAYAYLTVIESSYFTGGKYTIQKSSASSALGPFQLLTGTAQAMGMRTGGGAADERRFFVPSACGAAKYMRYLVNIFDDADTTLAILGYFQGEGGAAAAIYCAFDPAVKDREACVAGIGKTYDGGDYGRFLKQAKRYNYNYVDMSKRSMGLTRAMRDYVNRKLAVYFIANNMRKYNFSVPSDAPTKLPANGTVMPSASLKDTQCGSAVSSLF